jgi:histone H3
MSRRRKVYEEVNVSKNSIRKLALKAGAKRMGGMIYEELRGVMKVYISILLKNTITFTEYGKRKTIKVEDIEGALAQMGKAYGGYDKKGCGTYETHIQKQRKGEGKSQKYRPGTVTLRSMNYYQKNSACLAIAKAVFSRLIRRELQYMSDDVRQVSEEAMIVLQFVTEAYMIDMLKDAVLVAIGQKNQTLLPRHIQTARRIRGERA